VLYKQSKEDVDEVQWLGEITYHEWVDRACENDKPRRPPAFHTYVDKSKGGSCDSASAQIQHSSLALCTDENDILKSDHQIVRRFGTCPTKMDCKACDSITSVFMPIIKWKTITWECTEVCNRDDDGDVVDPAKYRESWYKWEHAWLTGDIKKRDWLRLQIHHTKTNKSLCKAVCPKGKEFSLEFYNKLHNDEEIIISNKKITSYCTTAQECPAGKLWSPSQNQCALNCPGGWEEDTVNTYNAGNCKPKCPLGQRWIGNADPPRCSCTSVDGMKETESNGVYTCDCKPDHLKQWNLITNTYQCYKKTDGQNLTNQCQGDNIGAASDKPCIDATTCNMAEGYKYKLEDKVDDSTTNIMCFKADDSIDIDENTHGLLEQTLDPLLANSNQLSHALKLWAIWILNPHVFKAGNEFDNKTDSLRKQWFCSKSSWSRWNKSHNSDVCSRACEDHEMLNYHYDPTNYKDNKNQIRCIPICRPHQKILDAGASSPVKTTPAIWANLKPCKFTCPQGFVWEPSKNACLRVCICNPNGVVNPWWVREEFVTEDTLYEDTYSCLHLCKPTHVMVGPKEDGSWLCKRKCPEGTVINTRFSFLQHPDGQYHELPCLPTEDVMKFNEDTDVTNEVYSMPGYNPNTVGDMLVLEEQQEQFDPEAIVIPPSMQMFVHDELGDVQYWLEPIFDKANDPQYVFVDARDPDAIDLAVLDDDDATTKSANQTYNSYFNDDFHCEIYDHNTASYIKPRNQ